MSRPFALRWGAQRVEVDLSFRGGKVALTVGDRRLEADYRRDAGVVTLDVGGTSHRAAFARDARGLWISCRGRTWLITPEGRDGATRGAADATDEIRAPMTGRIVSVATSAGAAVKEGDLLLTLEAMKMEFKLTAPEDGTVSALEGAAGDRVELGQLLVRLRPADGATGATSATGAAAAAGAAGAAP